MGRSTNQAPILVGGQVAELFGGWAGRQTKPLFLWVVKWQSYLVNGPVDKPSPYSCGWSSGRVIWWMDRSTNQAPRMLAEQVADSIGELALPLNIIAISTATTYSASVERAIKRVCKYPCLYVVTLIVTTSPVLAPLLLICHAVLPPCHCVLLPSL